MHLSSLPGPYASGDLGPAAYRFADFLSSAGQRWWQMLPVTPMGAAPGYSPYSSDSAMAGSPWLVSLEALAEEGLLTPAEIAPPRVQQIAGMQRISEKPGCVASRQCTKADFDLSVRYREEKLRLAFKRFITRNGPVRAAFEQFRQREKHWLEDYSLFCALKFRSGGAEWHQWEPEVRWRNAAALEKARHQLRDEIAFHEFVQHKFDAQWRAFKSYCRRKNVGLIGDVPIFVAHDSADVWAHRHLFDLDAGGQPTCVTGYPPDVFNSEGQCWGHPQFIWDQHRAENYAWWLRRFRSALSRFDTVRIDHFLGFDQSWSIPAAAKKVAEGKWIPGGGMHFFRAVRKELGKGAQMIAEDIGELSPAALALRDDFGLPGMRVLQFAFTGDAYHRPHEYPRNCIAYTGTHDNDTLIGWYRKLIAASRRDKSARAQLQRARMYAGVCDDKEAHWAFIRSLYASAANTVIVPMQDLLGLDTQYRMNTPGTPEGNWDWRITEEIEPTLVPKMRELTELFGRS